MWHRTTPSDAPVTSSHGFVVETCQRSLTINGAPDDRRDFTSHTGLAAYRLLLEIATGLRSELVGETNVFGQIKRAYETQRAHLRSDQQRWIETWFTDTKAIRSAHLGGVGGDSYASLCRRLLKLDAGVPVAIVGGGQLAASMTQRFSRQAQTLFVRKQASFPTPGDVTVRPLTELTAQLEELGALLLCIPSAPAWEQTLRLALEHNPIPFVHLGYRSYGNSPLATLANGYALNDLFALKRAQENVRSLKIAAARRACAQRAETLFQRLLQQAPPAAHVQ